MARPSRTGGKTSEANARNASAAKGRKTTKTKPRVAPAATRRSVSDPSKDLKEAREQQAATAEILKVIASSPSDVQPVFNTIVANADRLIGGFSTGVYRFVGSMVHLAAFTPINPAADEMMRARFPRPIAGMWHFERAHAGETVEFADTETEAAALPLREIARARGFRSLLYVPLMSKGTAIGFIAVSRKNSGSFLAHHVELLRTFADQAVIAIENVRLFNEVQVKTAVLSESLQQQTATADVLKVISRSPFDLQNILDTLIESAALLCTAKRASLIHQKGQTYVRAALHGFPREAVAEMKNAAVDLNSAIIASRALRQCAVVHVADVNADPDYPKKAPAQILGGIRTVLSVPLVREGQPIGAITVGRTRVDPFTPQQIDLIRTFADQAVIAIENARLFNETQEALERQTATAEILKVIASSPSDVQPVFDAIATSSKRLVGAFSAVVFRFVDGVAHVVAFTPTSPAADQLLKASFPRPVAEFPPFERAHAGRVVQVPDTEAEPDERMKQLARARGFRSVLNAPLMSKETPLGMITVTRKDPGPFADHHVQLLQTFADQAVIAIENARLFEEVQAKTRDLTEALQQQTASAAVLKVISGSPGKIGPVFDKILASARQLCDAKFGHLVLFDGETWRAEALHNVPEAYASFWSTATIVADPETNLGRVQRSGKFDQVADVQLASGYLARTPLGVATAELGGARTLLTVPLLKEGKVIGGIALYRTEVRPFTGKQVELLSSFADQAVIAIENARLFEAEQARTRDLSEALTHQTGSGNILKVIASSPTDVGPVLKAIADSAFELCEADDAIVFLKDGGDLQSAAHSGPLPEGPTRVPITRGWMTGRSFLDRKPVHVRDLHSAEGAEFPDGQKIARRIGFRTMLTVPLLREDESIGVILLRRKEVHPFRDKQIALLQTFADQAVIAIGNVHMFEQVQAKTHDLSESLQQQTATSDVLKVISRSAFDLQPVLDTIVQTASRLCDAEYAFIYKLQDDGKYHMAANHGARHLFLKYAVEHPLTPGRGSLVGRTALERKTVHMPDCLADPEYVALEYQSVGHYRSNLGVPLLREGVPIGVIILMRAVVMPFTERQIELVTTFADQAVIAIGNVRLFEEVQARTRDLTEALEQQTATSEVLEVISSSPGELRPVFQKMLANATRVCGANFGMMQLWNGDTFSTAAAYNVPAAFAALREGKPIHVHHPRSGLANVLTSHQVVHIHDVTKGAAYLGGDPNVVQLADIGGARTVVLVPMLKEDEFIGTFTIYRQEVRPFTDKQIALVENFTKQAVIAIENTRLLRELRQRTDDLSEALVFQTGSSNILKVIASSPTDVGPALKAIVESACEICEAYDALVFLKDGGDLVFSAHHGPIPINLERWPINRRWVTGRAVVDKAPQHIHDLLGPEGDEFPEGRELQRNQGQRTVLSVPLLQEGEAIGVISLRRIEVQPFDDKQIELLKSFADQAVIAISNVRLFEQVQERTRELSRSLEDLRTAQDRLVQTEKLASLGQLTAGIAHEIKNPLNFVNNFSALSAELTDELNDVLRPAVLTKKMRQEVDELTGMIKDNLQKVVQHGKRADSIVKNMLLHSREGSGEHRPADINSLLDESLNLAYHGARAEKGEFNVTLERDFDADAGTIELFPQEITRAFLNLIANGVYAATRRKDEKREPGFEPTLRASTKDLGTTVEIRIRDNGTGIPAEVQEKMFNPFFTTKPAGEGTGLGLSMTHDIIVKQHGGRIDVATEAGQFTEFIIVLPRMAATGKAGADK